MRGRRPGRDDEVAVDQFPYDILGEGNDIGVGGTLRFGESGHSRSVVN
jgi:hypothetical protein